MDEELLDPIVELTHSTPSFPRILNRNLRPVLQHTCISSPYGPASTVFISGVPYALDTYRQFTTPVYAVFSRCGRGLPIPAGDIQAIVASILSRNETLPGYLRDGLDSIRAIVSASMDEPGEGMNLVIFNAEGLLLNKHEMEVLRHSYQPQKLYQFHMLYDQLVYPLIFWTGSGECGVHQSEKLEGSTTLI
jgi:hypothetical protein